jgi:hypothetical protein
MNRALPLALAVLGGCASNGSSVKSVIPGAVTATLQRAAGEGAESLLIGARWKAGDQYVVEVTSEADAHLYVVLLMESGAQHVVAPAEEGQILTLKRGEAMRVPLGGWATVEGACPGTDRLFVVASQRPLTLADTVLFNAIDRIRRFEVRGESCGEPPPSESAYEQPESAPPPTEAGDADATSSDLIEPMPPPAPPSGAGLAAEPGLFAGRAACVGRPECTGQRELKSQGQSYVAPFDELGVVVMELSFAHE